MKKTESNIHSIANYIAAYKFDNYFHGKYIIFMSVSQKTLTIILPFYDL